MRTIIWGIILSVIGAIGWVISVVFAVVTLGTFNVSYIFGLMFLLSLPIALVAELIKWQLKKKK